MVNIDGTVDHEIVEQGVTVLKNLLHRGAVGGDLTTGDGAGIMVLIPDGFFRARAASTGWSLPLFGSYGVAVVFLPRDPRLRDSCAGVFERICERESLKVLGWREVPVDRSVLGEQAGELQPSIFQCAVDGGGTAGEALERKLFVTRRCVEKAVEEELSGRDIFYIPSMSSRTIVYKGLMQGDQLPLFYQDLHEGDFMSPFAVVHQRYSTNTFPSWELAQPFRLLAHNGEINTLKGNINHMRSRESVLESPLFGQDIKKLLPVVDQRGSDSACLDNALELLLRGGRSLPHAMLMLVPEAWGAKYPLGPDQKGFFEYHAGLMEPWDGPAALAFSDGTRVGAMLDRNGLRPGRYSITRQGRMVFASEAGVLDLDPADIVEKGALRPGRMILVDLEKRRLLKNGEIKSVCARQQPYRRWVEENKITVRAFYGAVAPVKPERETLTARQRLFGYSREELQMILEPMASRGYEPVGSMGADIPPAVLSEKNQLLYSYFKQLFAQVTNPAIDPVREELVMTLMTFIGNPGNILSEVPAHARLIKLLHPILANEDLERIRNLKEKDFRTATVKIGFRPPAKGVRLGDALSAICAQCDAAYESGASLLILSDRNLSPGMIPVPALLAVSAVNQHLGKSGSRPSAGILVETGEARDVMHMALLLGYGATAINPYLAFQTIAAMCEDGHLTSAVPVAVALENYIQALCRGLLKIMSKMGISTLRSYRGAQVFEAVGLNREIVDKYFPGTASRIEGVGLDVIAAEAAARAESAERDVPPSPVVLPSGGEYRYRVDGERHLWTPEAIRLLQKAVRNGDTNAYSGYAELINQQAGRLCTLRGMFRFKERPSVPLEEVEPASSIMTRFVTGAMSFGSISREAHQTIAVAMNRIHAMSNCGEGGEDPLRYRPLPNGDSMCSSVKQVASGRFGVTIEYLVNGRDLQIKIAQGAKPGEGGQLPGHKVNREIARVRHSTPGVTLISPPPHHDIYSIEDLAQLIFDLKNANPEARISVKLVAEAGVGTVAAGVSKARADALLISGGDGGTGASPLSSIRHAGVPWELGLAETQQTLVLNRLRSRIRVQVDGQMKTGRDVVVAALLGAEEYGFATAVLVSLGCVMMRKCHANTCPAGIATQDPELRAFFSGKPEHVTTYFTMVAEEVRSLMAEMGFRRMEEMIGRSEFLDTEMATVFWKTRGLDFSKLFVKLTEGPFRCTYPQVHDIGGVLDRELITRAAPALAGGKRVSIAFPIRNVNRSTGAMLSGQIAKRFGGAGLPDDTITCTFKGSAGQSFGAFCAKGLTLILEGETNDYAGKGLSGGKLVVKPYRSAGYDPSENSIAGNVILYGATGGEAYFHGKAGERFAIRNSGALAVVEGVGDHGCEYMTGGRVVVLGRTGINFAAGMSGGIAYVYDSDRLFDSRCNLDMVDLELVTEKTDIEELRGLIERQLLYTGSRRAAAILDQWEACLPFFVKVFPMEYRRVLGKMSKEDEATERTELDRG